MYVKYKEIEIARSVNFINFMLDEHEDLIEIHPTSKIYIHPEHHSLKFYEHGFFRFSTNEGGDGIRFLREYCGLTFQEAVMELYHYADGEIQTNNLTYGRKNQSFTFPTKSQKYYKRVYTYLTVTRCIPRETVKKLIKEGLLYEDVKGNAVFVNQTPGREFAISRGTVSYAEDPFKRIDTSESNNYWILKNQSVNTVYVCESPIDAVSLYELLEKRPGAYIAMGGAKDKTLFKIISDYPGSQIVIATDWDSKGEKFVKENAKYCSKVLRPNKTDMKNTKDWNEVLKKKFYSNAFEIDFDNQGSV